MRSEARRPFVSLTSTPARRGTFLFVIARLRCQMHHIPATVAETEGLRDWVIAPAAVVW
jgi:hypothetical protein